MWFLDISSLALISANLITMYGVLFLGWDLGNILFLYWLESAIIGASTIIKMIFAHADTAVGHFAKIAAVPFFCIHYGGFMFGHLIFLIIMSQFLITGEPDGVVDNVRQLVFDRLEIVQPAIIGLSISHLLSLIFNYFGKGEWKVQTVAQLFSSPYKRIIVMHLTLLLGMFASFIFGQSIFILLIFVALKIVVDLRAHVQQHAVVQNKI
jgi:hypothetical protein